MLARTPFDLLDRDFNDLFRRTLGDLSPAAMSQATRAWMPAMDVYVRDGELHVRLECPGIDPDNDVDIEIAEGRLTIRGDRRHEEQAEEGSYWRREMTSGHFERTIVLPQGVDASDVTASYDAGILDITVPLPKAQANKVKVEVGPNASRKQLTDTQMS